MSSIYDLQMASITGEQVGFDRLRDQVLLIVNVASMSHKRGGPGASVHYASAKGAVLTMSLGVAREFAGQGIRCLSISPGPIDTPFQATANTSPELMQQFKADVPMGRFGEPEEIGELVVTGLKNKGKQNKRISLALVQP